MLLNEGTEALSVDDKPINYTTVIHGDINITVNNYGDGDYEIEFEDDDYDDEADEEEDDQKNGEGDMTEDCDCEKDEGEQPVSSCRYTFPAEDFDINEFIRQIFNVIPLEFNTSKDTKV